MVKQGHLRLMSIVFVLAFFASLFLSACTANTGSSNPTISSFTPTAVQSQYNYPLPNWWRPCLKRDSSGNCTTWDMTKNPADCDSYNNPQANPTPLAIWGGLEVCEPLVGKSNLVPVNFAYPTTSSENEFQCTELVKRYLFLKDSSLLSLGNTDGDQVVDNYTAKYSTWHKVVNDDPSSNLYSGNLQMMPDVGDVLSYGPTSSNSSGHTSIVVGASMTSPGTGTITVIQENIYWNHVAVPIEPLNVIKWVIQPSSHGAGTVTGWMTTRPLASSPQPAGSPVPTLPSRFSGTLDEYQNSTTYQVALEIKQTHADGSFDGKWYATINGSKEDVIVNGVIVPFNESNRFSQISQDKAQQMQQQFGSDGTLLWFTSTSYDVGQDIWLGSEYYGLLKPDGSVQGLWYPPGSNAEGGTFQLA